MTKKVLIGLGILVLAIAPFIASAQVPVTEASNCCIMRHKITTAAGVTYNPGDAVGEIGIVAAGECYAKGSTITANLKDEADWGGVCTMDTVYTVTDWIFWIFLAFVVIMGVWTGFMFMTAGGDPGKIEKARGMIVYLVIGIVVAVIVKLIPALTRSIIGI